jgi:UDP-N-acetylmuramate dehydrogenase
VVTARRWAGDRSSPTAKAIGSLVSAFGDRAVPDGPLGARTTYRVGGKARLYVEIDTSDDLSSVHRALAESGGAVPVLVVGQGSNLLVSDSGFDGVALGLGAAFEWIEVSGLTVRAGATVKLPVLARRTVAAGLGGLEWAVGVPGSVGGALRMNAGGHGSDTASVLTRCGIYDLSLGEERELPAQSLDLSYRRSALGPGEVVLWAEFALEPVDREQSGNALTEIVKWRREHQPGGSNAGSVFVNPPGDAAGRLVELAGLKGFRMGSAQVSDRHANFIQADERGSADDVRRLMEHVRSEVSLKTGIELSTEVRLVGFEDSPDLLVRAGRGAPSSFSIPSTSSRGRGMGTS